MREAMDVPLPIPAALGIDGRTPPDITIDDDRLTAFDPDTDGIDFGSIAVSRSWYER